MKLLGSLFFTSTLLFATNVQEMTLDKLQNKKIVPMSEKEFENYLFKQERLKEKIEAKKEEKAKKIVAEHKIVETVISNDEKVVDEKTTPLSVVENDLPKKIEKKASIPIVEKNNTESSLAEKISNLDLASVISFLLNKTNELSVFEFEQSKQLLVNKMMQDKRFDKEALSSMNVLVMNKNQFLVFLSDLKTSMINR